MRKKSVETIGVLSALISEEMQTSRHPISSIGRSTFRLLPMPKHRNGEKIVIILKKQRKLFHNRKLYWWYFLMVLLWI